MSGETMKKNSLALFLLSMIIFSAATSRGQAVPASCSPPPECAKPTKNNPFCIDARRLGPPAQSASYGHSSVVGVWLTDKNPFRYDYQVKTTLKDFSKEDSDAISAFEAAIGLSTGKATTPAAPTTNLPQKGADTGQAKPLNKAQKFLVQPASHCQPFFNDVDALSRRVETALGDVQTDEKELADYLKTGSKKVKDADLENSGMLREQLLGEQLCKKAVQVQDFLDGFTSAPIPGGKFQGRRLSDAADSLTSDISVLKNAMGAYQQHIDRIPCKSAIDCQDARFKTAFLDVTQCTEEEFPSAIAAMEKHVQYLQTAKTSMSETQKHATEISAAQCNVDAAQSQIVSVLSDDRAFFERIGPFGPYSDSEDVSITVSRADKKQKDACNTPAGKSEDTTAAAPPKPATPPAKPGSSSSSAPDPSTVIIADVTLHFGGGQRVYAAAGTAVSFLPVKEFQRATGFTSGTTSGTIIDFKTNSTTRISPLMGFLHWRPLDCEHLFLSFGATAKSDNQSTSPEFLFGPSWGFLGNRIFFTGGAYVGQQQKLAGNLHVGDTVPSSLTGEIPVQKSYHWSGGFSINFRITGGGGSSSPTQKTAKQPTGSGSQ
jgi:hypothetical protein